MAESLLQAARTRVLVADGGIGTELQLAGLTPGGCAEAWNVDRPDAVRAVHAAYANAGAQVLLTNTFGGNACALERHGLQARARELNLAAPALVRDVAGPGRWVMGDVGPFGGFLEPLGEYRAETVEAAFREQIAALLEGGADGVWIETMTSLEELALSIRAARAAGAPVIIASLAFDGTAQGPRTMMGVSPEAAAAVARAEGAHALSANCGTSVSIEGYADIMRRFHSVWPDAILLCRPNAGTPHIEHGRVHYPLDPQGLAAGAALLVEAGARVIGGCCGTTPAHIAALAAVLSPSPSH